MFSLGGHLLPFVGKSGFLVDNVLVPLKHDVFFTPLAFTVADTLLFHVKVKIKHQEKQAPRVGNLFIFIY